MATAIATDLPLFTDQVLVGGFAERRIRSIANEIAMDLLEINDILKNHDVSQNEWLRLATNPLFNEMVAAYRSEWSSAKNTRERVDLKTLLLVESGLETMHALMNDPREPANARVEVFKSLQRGAGIGKNDPGTESVGKVSLTINMGGGQSIKVEQTLPQNQTGLTTTIDEEGFPV